MKDPTTHLPSWFPWATTAIMAVLVACVGEMWQLEKSKSQLVRDEAAFTATELKGVQNRLEAEQIVSRQALGKLGEDFKVEFLSFHGRPSKVCGAVVWNSSSPKGSLVLFNLPKRAVGGDYQLWLVDTGPGAKDAPSSCKVFESPPPVASFRENVDIAVPGSNGLMFVLVFGKKGGFATLDEAVDGGSIVLASPHWDGKND